MQRLRQALGNADVDTPLNVIEGQREPHGLPDRSVLLMPLTMKREPAGGGKQRWTLRVGVVLRSRAEADEPHARLFDDMRETLRVLLSVNYAGGVDDGEWAERGDEVTYLYAPDASTGYPLGAATELAFQFRDE